MEFDTKMEKNEDKSLKMAHFVKNYAENEGLLPFHRSAIAKIIDYNSRLIEEQSKLSTRFQVITKVLVESSYWAKQANALVVDESHIHKSLFEQMHRSNHISEQYREMITERNHYGRNNGI